MNRFTRMLLILFITIASSGTASGLDKLDRFINREGRRLERIERIRDRLVTELNDSFAQTPNIEIIFLGEWLEKIEKRRKVKEIKDE